MKTFASIAAVLCVTVVAAMAAPRPYAPAYQYGLTDNAWWAAQGRRAHAAAPDLAYGLAGNDWWASRSHALARRAD